MGVKKLNWMTKRNINKDRKKGRRRVIVIVAEWE